MTHEGRADFDGFVPQKNKRGRNFAKENYIPDIVMQAENIVNSFVSSKTNTERRYKDFSSRLCGETGMTNSYPYVNITQDGTPKHLGGTRKPVVSYDEDFFKNKNVIIFDDVITSGGSMLRMKEKLVRMGATVIAGISIGKTFHHRPEDQNVNTRRSSIFDDDLPF